MRNIWFVPILLFLPLSFLLSNEIIPTPKITESQKFLLPWKTSITLFSIEASPLLQLQPVSAKAIQLAGSLPVHFSTQQSDVKIRLKIKGQNLNVDEEIAKIVSDSLLGKKEGYFLSLKQDEILIYGFDHAGLLYGVQSLRQLMSAFSNGNPLRIQTIIDYPSFSFRGVMDDISRGPLSSLQFLRMQVERLSLLKINVFSFYIEHILKTSKHYAYAPSDALTIAELQELAIYADSLNIHLMGSFQSLGHFKNILSHPDYQHLGTSERMLKPAEQTSLQFLYGIYDELIPVSTHEIFNINGDEAYDLDRGADLSELAEEIGKGAVYLNHVYPLLQHVQKQGKTPALWGDMLLLYPEVISQLPTNTVVFTWNYEARENFDDFIQPFTSHNIPFIVTPGIINSYRLWPDLQEAKVNIANFTYEGWKAGSQGVLYTVWDDGGRHFFHCDWYGVAMGAEHSWNPQEKETENFSQKFIKIFYQGSGEMHNDFLNDLRGFQQNIRLRNLDNALIQLQYKITETNGFIDTTGFNMILDQAEKTIHNIFRIARETTSANALFPKSDFNFWLFKIEELKESLHSALTICKIRDYKKNLQQSDQTIAKSIDSLAELRLSNWRRLSDQFRTLWFIENRNYFYEDASSIYTNNIALWKDIANIARANNLAILPVYIATPDSYFTYWLSAGPFLVNNRENVHTDYFKHSGGEDKIQPVAVDFFMNQKGSFDSWKKIISTYPSHLNLNEFYPEAHMKVIYASCQLYAEEDIVLSYELRFRGQHKAFLNGEVIRNETSNERGISDGELRLRAGRNDLTLKLMSGAANENNFSFFLPGKQVISNKYRYYISSPE